MLLRTLLQFNFQFFSFVPFLDGSGVRGRLKKPQQKKNISHTTIHV